MNATPDSPVPDSPVPDSPDANVPNADPQGTLARADLESGEPGTIHVPPPEASPNPPAGPDDVACDVATLVEEGQGLVRSIAMQVFRGLPVRMDLDDLIAYGQIGLTEAAQKFDPECGTRFTTFAYYRIRGAIYDGVSKMNWTSRARIRRMRFHRMADEVLENEAGSGTNTATSSDDASWLGRVTEKLAIVYLATGDDESANRSLADAPDRYDPPSQLVANRELQETLRRLVDRLAPDAKRLITGIYFDGYTLTEAADRSGISKSWASRLHAKSLDELAIMLRRIGSD